MFATLKQYKDSSESIKFFLNMYCLGVTAPFFVAVALVCFAFVSPILKDLILKIAIDRKNIKSRKDLPLPPPPKHTTITIIPIEQFQLGFKHCDKCQFCLSSTDPHTECLVCLGRSHPMFTCHECLLMTLEAFQVRIFASIPMGSFAS